VRTPDVLRGPLHDSRTHALRRNPSPAAFRFRPPASPASVLPVETLSHPTQPRLDSPRLTSPNLTTIPPSTEYDRSVFPFFPGTHRFRCLRCLGLRCTSGFLVFPISISFDDLIQSIDSPLALGRSYHTSRRLLGYLTTRSLVPINELIVSINSLVMDQ
jgi:hypothetical protein